MSKPRAEILEGERDKLFVTDAEMIRRLGVPEKTARAAIRMLDLKRDSGFVGKPPILAGGEGLVRSTITFPASAPVGRNLGSFARGCRCLLAFSTSSPALVHLAPSDQIR